MATKPRNLAPFLSWIRNFLLGRSYKNSLRFQDFVATRSPPPPNLPDGVSHNLSENYYLTRDGRHFARPPHVLIEGAKKLALPAEPKKDSEAKGAAAKKKSGHITPGVAYQWLEAPKEP